MAESSTPEEMLSSDESSGELRADIPDHNLILYVTGARVLRVEFTNCQSWPHETSWICPPTLNLSLNKEFCPQLGVLKERWESRGEHLTSIHSGSLTFVFGHDTEFKAIQMVARHSEIKKAILLFLHKIGSQVEDISMKAVVQKAKRTAKGTAKRRHKESDQIITGMDGDSKAIHSNVCGAQIVHEMHQDFRNIHIGDVYNLKCEGGTHETSWRSTPAPNKHISQVPRESFHRFGRRIREFFRATLTRVAPGSLIFSFAHSTSEDAIDMIVKHRKVKEVFLDFVQELDPSIEDIRIEVVLRELSVSEEQTTQITETRPRGMADPEHKDEEGASRSHTQQKDDDETSHPHIQETGDDSSSLSHSPQKKDEDTCLPHPQKTDEDTSHLHPQKTEEDKTSLQQTDEDTSHLHPQKTEEDKTSLQQTEEDTSHLHPQKTEEDKTSLQQTDEDTSNLHPQKTEEDKTSLQQTDEDTSHLHPQKTEEDKTSLQQTDEDTSHLHPQEVYVKDTFKYQHIRIKKGSGPHSSGYTSSHQSKDMSGSESVPFVPLTTQESDPHASSDPSQGHSQTERGPRLSTASHATPSQADRDLYWASRAGDLEEVKRLLSTPGVDVDCRVGGGSQTPVMRAAYRGHREVVELLVSEGADVSLVDKFGYNILHWACIGGDMETVEYVLSLNVVDIDARNMWGETAAGWARIGGRQPVVELLKSRGAQ